MIKKNHNQIQYESKRDIHVNLKLIKAILSYACATHAVPSHGGNMVVTRCKQKLESHIA